jgi:hypothetical protein
MELTLSTSTASAEDPPSAPDAAHMDREDKVSRACCCLFKDKREQPLLSGTNTRVTVVALDATEHTFVMDPADTVKDVKINLEAYAGGDIYEYELFLFDGEEALPNNTTLGSLVAWEFVLLQAGEEACSKRMMAALMEKLETSESRFQNMAVRQKQWSLYFCYGYPAPSAREAKTRFMEYGKHHSVYERKPLLLFCKSCVCFPLFCGVAAKALQLPAMPKDPCLCCICSVCCCCCNRNTMARHYGIDESCAVSWCVASNPLTCACANAQLLYEIQTRENSRSPTTLHRADVEYRCDYICEYLRCSCRHPEALRGGQARADRFGYLCGFPGLYVMAFGKEGVPQPTRACEASEGDGE